MLILVVQSRRMKKLFLFFLLTVCYSAYAQTFRVHIDASLNQPELDGRLILLLSKNNDAEPRFQVNDGPTSQLIFGTDIEGWKPNTTKLVDVQAIGYPIERLSEVPAGDYYVQVLIHKYETFHLKTGQTVKLPMDRGEGQHWNIAPGNIYSVPVKIHFDPSASTEVALNITKIIPPIKQPEDTKYIKHIRIQSKLLTEFWGRPMYLGANILLPGGFDEHPNVKYPLAIFHGHFPADFDGFSTTAPDPNMKPGYFRAVPYYRV